MRPDDGAQLSTHHYCHECKAIQPVIRDDKPGMDISGAFVGCDIICYVCAIIIATEYWSAL